MEGEKEQWKWWWGGFGGAGGCCHDTSLPLLNPPSPIFSSSLSLSSICIPAALPTWSCCLCFYLSAWRSCSGCHRSLWLDVREECRCVALHVYTPSNAVSFRAAYFLRSLRFLGFLSGSTVLQRRQQALLLISSQIAYLCTRYRGHVCICVCVCACASACVC